MKAYLSGSMEFKENLGTEWREWITKELEKIGYGSVDPTKLEEDNNIQGPVQYRLTDLKLAGQLDEVREITRRTLFKKDMYGIQLSDILIVLYDTGVQKGAGTLAETWEAFREGRPIYAVSELPIEQIPTWLIGETTQLFFNFQDLLIYLTDKDQVAQDIKNAVLFSDEVLGGLYKGNA